MKRKYTEKMHAHRLIKILNKKNTCDCCPAARKFTENNILWKTDPCEICTEFLGYKPQSRFSRSEDLIFPIECPCYYFGPAEAVKRTWIALEEKGYI